MTFSQPQIYYILDNIDEAIKYDGNALLVNRPQLYYGGTNTFFKEFCNVQFDGISISFIGGLTGKNISVSIDRLDPSPEVALDTAYSTWYQSELLLEGSHSISITLATNIESSLDFMSVEPGLTTNLTGKTLIMDDTYPAIQYGGDWEAVMYSPGVVAFQSNSHHTSTAGSNLTFTYVGSDMTVYGLYDTGSAGGSFELKSTVDSNPSSTQTFTGNLTSKLSWGNHIALFTTQELSLEPGQHTVTLELVSCDPDQLLRIDYIQYTPSFSSLAELLNTSSGAVNNDPVSAMKRPVSGIAGGLVGGVVLLTLLGLFLVWRRKHQRRQSRSILPAYMDSMALKPFPGSPTTRSIETDTQR